MKGAQTNVQDTLAHALKSLLDLPPYDGTQETSRQRLIIKHRAKKALKLWKDSHVPVPENAELQRRP